MNVLCKLFISKQRLAVVIIVQQELQALQFLLTSKKKNATQSFVQDFDFEVLSYVLQISSHSVTFFALSFDSCLAHLLLYSDGAFLQETQEILQTIIYSSCILRDKEEHSSLEKWRAAGSGKPSQFLFQALTPIFMGLWKEGFAPSYLTHSHLYRSLHQDFIQDVSSKDRGAFADFFWQNLQQRGGLPRQLSGKESACQYRRCRRHGFNPWIKKMPWSRKWQPTPVFLPGKFHGQRGTWGFTVHRITKSSDMTVTELTQYSREVQYSILQVQQRGSEVIQLLLACPDKALESLVLKAHPCHCTRLAHS